MFSREQYRQWRSFPEISRDELFRYFTLTSADVAFVDPGAGRGPADRLGIAVQLSTLPWLGFVPDDVVSAPPVAVARLAEQLGLDPGALRGYGKRAHTRSDHLGRVARYLTWKTAARHSAARAVGQAGTVAGPDAARPGRRQRHGERIFSGRRAPSRLFGVYSNQTSGSVARMRQDRVQMLVIGHPPRTV